VSLRWADFDAQKNVNEKVNVDYILDTNVGNSAFESGGLQCFFFFQFFATLIPGTVEVL